MAELTRPKKKSKKKSRAPEVLTKDAHLPDVLENVTSPSYEGIENHLKLDAADSGILGNILCDNYGTNENPKILTAPPNNKSELNPNWAGLFKVDTEVDTCNAVCNETVEGNNVNPLNRTSFRTDSATDIPTQYATYTHREDSAIDVANAPFEEGVYDKVTKELHECIIANINVPSAPALSALEEVEEEDKSSIILNDFLEKVRIDIKDVLQCFDGTIECFEGLVPFSNSERRLLYNDEELLLIPDFINNFIYYYKNPSHELFSILMKYLKHRLKVKQNLKKLADLKEELEIQIPQLWTVWKGVELKETALCKDKRQLEFVHYYQNARFNEDVQSRIVDIFGSIEKISCYDLELNSLQVQYIKQQIVYHIELIEEISCSFTSLNDTNVQCIHESQSALFYFERSKEAILDREFLTETRSWIKELVWLLYQIGSWDDYMFVWCHVLRCPGGVSSWATPLLQVPAMSCHILAILSLLLRPIDSREEFLNDLSTTASDSKWLIIDSDGEYENNDDGLYPLKEDDLIQFFDQIPLFQFFERLFNNMDNLNSEMVLRKLAVLQNMISILHEGIKTFNWERYKLFQRKLGKLVRTVVSFATALVESFVSTLKMPPTSRIQGEYDELVISAARCLADGTEGVWLFLATMPFHLISDPASFRMLALMHMCETLNFDLSDYEQKFILLPEQDQCHLISAMSNLVINKNNQTLMKCVQILIVYTGCYSSVIDEGVAKHAQTTLSSLCFRHPHLLSNLIEFQHAYMRSNKSSDQPFLLSIWKELPVPLWYPTTRILQIIINWLQISVGHSNNASARIILQRLDYSVMSHNIQVNIAFSILNAVEKQPGVLTQWAWQCLPRLRLHLVDWYGALGVSDHLHKVSALDSFAHLHTLTQKGDPLACLIALSLTDVGHFVPNIYRTGFSLLKPLRHFKVVLLCLYNMTTMFVSCPDSLVSCEEFISVLTDLLTLENGMLSFVNGKENSIAQAIAAMIANQMLPLINGYLYNCISMWVRSLTLIKDWYHNAGVILILDAIFRYAMFNQQCWLNVGTLMGSLASAESTVESPVKSTLSSLFNFFGVSNSPFTLLPAGYNEKAPWFAYTIISAEFEAFEVQNNLWFSLLKEIWNGQKKRLTVESALKNVCSYLNVANRGVRSLAIHRWAMQILCTDASHPVYILLWQKFFTLYFTRIPGIVDRGCVGDAFFKQGDVLTRLEANLKRNANIVKGTTLEASMDAFSLWLHNQSLCQPNLLLLMLPKQYETNLLKLVIEGDSTPWIYLIPPDTLMAQDDKFTKVWSNLLGRCENIIKKPFVPKENSKSIQSIQSEFSHTSPIILSIDGLTYTFEKRIDSLNEMTAIFARSQKLFKKYKDKFNISSERLSSGFIKFWEASEKLYVSKQKSVTMTKKCNGVEKYVNNTKRFYTCSGGVSLKFTFVEWTLDPKACHNQKQVLTVLDSPINVVSCYSKELITMSVQLYKLLDVLTCQFRKTKFPGLQERGVELFSVLQTSWTPTSNMTPFLKKLFTELITASCRAFIQNHPQNCTLLLKAISSGNHMLFLEPLFHPLAASDDVFVEMYESVYASKENILKRFDISEWLEKRQPSLNIRSRLLKSILYRSSHPSFNTCIHVLASHMRLILLYRPTDHFYEILAELLKLSASGTIPQEYWIEFICALYNIDPSQLIPGCAPDATFFLNLKQSTIPSAFVVAAIQKLVTWFSDERRSVISLYSNYEKYIFVLSILHGTFAITLIFATTDMTAVWPLYIQLFSTWLFPEKKFGKLQYPFTEEEVKSGNPAFFASVFNTVTRIYIEHSAMSNVILKNLWQLISNNCILPAASDNFTSIMNASLLSLPWDTFQPDLLDLEMMFEMETIFQDTAQLGSNSLFLSHVFSSVNWVAVFAESRRNSDLVTHSRLHCYFLHLFVIFSNDTLLNLSQEVYHLLALSSLLFEL